MRNFQIDIIITDPELNNGIIISELSDIEYDGFWETDEGISAFIAEIKYNEEKLNQIINKYDFAKSFNAISVENINWNVEWESNYSPINVEDDCLIRSPFHPEDPTFLVEVIIQPQMSFGTGHHDTTYLMVKHLLMVDLNEKIVLDMGCGTGVLSILAEKMGAQVVWAIDNDDWAYKNTISNCLLNATENVSIKHGDGASIPDRKFDFILANINKNVLIKDIKEYTKHLKDGGNIFLSGFFEIDLTEMKTVIKKAGLNLDDIDVKNEWAFIKSTLVN
jgi:ribosomal protein L11 methyltransferase